MAYSPGNRSKQVKEEAKKMSKQMRKSFANEIGLRLTHVSHGHKTKIDDI